MGWTSIYFSSKSLKEAISRVERGSWTSRLKQARCIIQLGMSVSLLSTKLYIPPARPNAIARPRPTEKIIASLSQPGSFVLLSGPAGFGKTTLLSEFVARHELPVAWVTLDEGDNEPVRFWSYLIARFYHECRQDTFILWGGADVARQIEIFAQEVVPAVRERI